MKPRYSNLLSLVAIGSCAGCATPQDTSYPATMIDTKTAEHYIWGGKNDGWYLVKRRDLTIIQERMVPGGEEIRHYHRKARQFFFVLAGTLTMEADGDDNIVKAGQGIEIEPGKVHQARNPGGEPVDFLVASMPNSHGDRVEVVADH